MAYQTTIPILVWILGSAPLVKEDLRSLTVPAWMVFGALGVFGVTSVMIGREFAPAAVLSAGVLTVGALGLLMAPDSVGEADVIYLAALAWLSSFWHLLLAVGVASLLAGTVYMVLPRLRQASSVGTPVPFLPFLFLGGLAALLGAP
jgi:prepilin signal peptidase PulO-like enzyme (type II secretory pathway)